MTQTVPAPTRAEFRACAERLLDFLAAQFDAEGRHRTHPEAPAFHYKLVYVFNYGGRRGLALRVLDHLEQTLIAADGSFRDPQLNGADSQYLYQAGWLAWGCAALGRFDLARRLARRAAAAQDPAFGGFWNATDLGRVQWLLNSSSAAAGCAAAGELAPARAAARYMARLYERQPDPANRFYFSLDAQGEVIAQGGAEPTRNFFDLHGWARPAMLATAIAGLVWTGRQTGEAAHYDLAQRYAAVILSHRHHPERMQFASKSGWAVLQLAPHRPDPALRAYAEGVGRRALELQAPDGSVDVRGWPGLAQGAPPAITLNNGCDWALTALALGHGGA
ncbi:MAG: hypothetical protein FJ029_03950 [Actinobacteria bacterium]|nr:hypothetical protein [Actinomycetota bacterium]